MAKTGTLPRPTADTSRAQYDRDVFAWAMDQARLIREGRFAEVDVENVAEEIESVGRSERNSLRSYLALVIQHLLKWDHQPALRSASWSSSIRVHRLHAQMVLEENPGLKSQLPRILAEAYRLGTAMAAQETGMPEQSFPASCPYDLDHLLLRRLDV